MDFCESWIEYDYNPFVSFDKNGKVKYINQEAQYLLGETTTKNIFELARDYANITYGFKTTVLDIGYGSFSFYAITVGYMDEEEIGIKLYKKAAKKLATIGEYGEIVNIYSLLDLCISAASASSAKTKHIKIFDPAFPDIRLEIEEFTKLVNKIFQSYLDSSTIKTKLTLNTGEYLKFNNKKYPIFSLHIDGENRDETLEKQIEQISVNANSIVQFKDTKTIICSALISN
ncbi:MAG: hypothetical protein GXP61_00260 [Epsilonproteobacteria bacterium]|nr:hypothetical protein [Campylobacterota bacterium]